MKKVEKKVHSFIQMMLLENSGEFSGDILFIWTQLICVTRSVVETNTFTCYENK